MIGRCQVDEDLLLIDWVTVEAAGSQRRFTPCCNTRRAASVHTMLLGCIVAGFCGTLDASRGQHLSLDSHLAFAVSADAIRALDVVNKKVIRSELNCLISSLVHPPHKHAHSASASAYPIKC